MLIDNCFKKLSKEFRDLSKKVDKAYDSYGKALEKYDCDLCPKKLDASKVGLEKAHDKCGSCKVAHKVLPIFKDLLEVEHKLTSFIENEYGLEAYNYLKKLNPIIKYPNGSQSKFLDYMNKPYRNLSLADKRSIIYLVEGTSRYHIV